MTPRARRIAGRTPPVNRTLGKISGTYDLRGGSENSIRATLPRTAPSSPKPLQNLSISVPTTVHAVSALVVPRGPARRPRAPARAARARGADGDRAGACTHDASPRDGHDAPPGGTPFASLLSLEREEPTPREKNLPRPNTLTSPIGGLYRPKSIGRDLAVPTNRPAVGVVRFHDRAERFSYTFVGFAKSVALESSTTPSKV